MLSGLVSLWSQKQAGESGRKSFRETSHLAPSAAVGWDNKPKMWADIRVDILMGTVSGSAPAGHESKRGCGLQDSADWAFT